MEKPVVKKERKKPVHTPMSDRLRATAAVDRILTKLPRDDAKAVLGYAAASLGMVCVQTGQQ